MRPPHLLVDISAHGLGHLAQTAAVLAELRRRQPTLQLTLRTALPTEQLLRRIERPFVHLAAASDFGFVMHNAVDIDYAASARRYREFHADWPHHVAAYAGQLTSLGVTAVLANAAYLPLAAAAAAGLPGIGMCSLNWADLFKHYFGAETWAPAIHQDMLNAYAAARVFLRISPGLPMSDFKNRLELGPVARLGGAKPALRAQLAASLGLPPEARWVLVAMGGMEFRLPVETWPISPELVWLCPQSWGVRRDDVVAFADQVQQPNFTDILTAADAVLTKPGYGTFAEAACNGTPLLYLPRDDWPEEPYLVAWLQRHGRIAAVARRDLLAGTFVDSLHALWRAPSPPPPAATGAAEAAAAIMANFAW